MSGQSTDKSALDRLLDAGVYAPLGLVLTRDQVRDDAIKAGRKQVAFARSLGRAALQGFGRSSNPAAASPKTTEPMSDAELVDYDTLSARDIVELLGSASVERARWIRSRESSTKGRVTILRAADKVLGRRD